MTTTATTSTSTSTSSQALAPSSQGGGPVALPEAVRELIAAAQSLMHKSQFDEAASILSDVLEELVATYGQLAPETGRVYQLYGMALMEIARAEAPILAAQALEQLVEGNEPTALTASSVAHASGPGDEPQDGEIDGAKNKKKKKAAAPQEADEDDDDDDEDDDGGDENDDSNDGEREADSPGGDNDDDDDQVSNLQIGWECLECARLIFKGMGDKRSMLRLAEIYFEFSKLMFETQQFDQAIQEIQACLDLRKTWAAGSKDLVLAHKQHGSILYSSGQYKEAIDAYEAALKEIAFIIADPDTKKRLRKEIDGIKGDIVEAQATVTKALQQSSKARGSAKSSKASVAVKGQKEPVTTDGFDTATMQGSTATTHSVATIKPRSKKKGGQAATTATSSVSKKSANGKRRIAPATAAAPLSSTSSASSSSGAFDTPQVRKKAKPAATATAAED